MAAPLFIRNSVLLGKVESTYGTDPTPTVADDAILSTPPNFSVESEVLDRIVSVGDFSPVQGVVGKQQINMNFNVEFKSQTEILEGSSSAPLQLDSILRASGFAASYTAESGGGADDGYVEYDPISTGQESATFYYYSGKEVLHKVTGSYCNWSLEAVAGQYANLSVDVLGNYVAPTDTTASAPTYESNIPVAIESIGLSFGSVTGTVVRNFNIDLNNEIVERADVNSPNGLKGRRIAGRRPTITFQVEKELVATWGIYAALKAGTTYNTTCTIGTTDGQKIDISIPKLALQNISESEDAGIVMLDVEAICTRTSGNDELSFKFY